MRGLRLHKSVFATTRGTVQSLFSDVQDSDNSLHALLIRTFSISTIANLKYVQFKYKNNPNEIRVGFMDSENVVDINKHNSCIPSTMLGILQSGCCCLLDVLCLKNSMHTIEPISCINLVAPITGMDKVLCVGLNYADHCKEKKLEIPKVPMMFSKFASTIIGQSEPLKIRSQVTKEIDWEVELAVVIGTKCTNVKAADAYNYVFGYTVAQDITSRDWQKKNAGQFLLGKNQDSFCPIGPCIVTKDEIADPQNLNISCSVNGVQKQNGNTSDLIHKIPDVIERLSSVMTLLPGDILLSGTPAGVGANRNPPEFLKSGDKLRSEIENIGAFEVTVENF